MNALGGVYNFISRNNSEDLSGKTQLQRGIQGDSNPLYRVDGVLGRALENDWFFNAAGHYRHDYGARNTDFTFSRDGPFKFNVIKENFKDYNKLYGKYLNDYTNRYTGVTTTNWNDQKPAFGLDFNSSALMMPEFHANIPDGRNLNNTISFDPSQGVHAKDLAFGFDLFQNLGNDRSVKNNMNFSSKKAN